MGSPVTLEDGLKAWIWTNCLPQMIMEFKGDGVRTGTSAGFGLLEIGFGTENK